jgi:hypothetical protein
MVTTAPPPFTEDHNGGVERHCLAEVINACPFRAKRPSRRHAECHCARRAAARISIMIGDSTSNRPTYLESRGEEPNNVVLIFAWFAEKARRANQHVFQAFLTTSRDIKV